MSTDYSRTIRLASRASDQEPTALESRIQATDVLVSIDPDEPAAALTVEVVVANLRRLPVRLWLDSRGGRAQVGPKLLERLQSLAAGIDPDRELRVGRPSDPTVHVHVGTGATSAAASGAPDGHGTRIRPHGSHFPRTLAPGTGLGAVLTGAMLSAEAFKGVVGVAANRRAAPHPIDFCPVSLGEPASDPPAPLPHLDRVALVGAGAIGTGITLILQGLGAHGAMTVVDPQVFEEPNVTTYSLGTMADATTRLAKVDLVARELPDVDVQRLVGTAHDLVAGIDDRTLLMPTVVLGAVDSIAARHEIASIHAARTFDGSTGGAAGTTLSLAEALPHGPCLRCYYPAKAAGGPSTEQQVAHLTGISLSRIARGQDLITEADLAHVDPKHREVVRSQIGRPICGLARALGLTGAVDEYRPSAAFVAQQAAALVVGALIRSRSPAFIGAQLDVEYDAMFGPQKGMTAGRVPNPLCRCQTSADLIEQVREQRGVVRRL